MDIILIRHFATKENLQKKYIGFTDVPIVTSIHNEKTYTNESMSPIFISPLLRCRETAEIMFPKSVKIVIENLKEMNFGSFENKNYDELNNNSDYTKWLNSNCETKCPNGESKSEFIMRTKSAFCEIIEYGLSKKMNSLIVIAHDGTAKAAAEAFLKTNIPYFSFKLSYGESLKFKCHENEWRKHQILTIDN